MAGLGSLFIDLLARTGKFETDIGRAARLAERRSRDMQRSFDRLGQRIGAALGAYASVQAVQSIIRISDQYTQLRGRLALVTEGTQELGKVQAELFNIAQRTRTEMSGVADLYVKLAQSGRELGASQQELLQFTEGVGNALTVSGASAQQASGALLQLSQALAGGTVRAEEFNSMMEGAPEILRTVAANMEGMDGSIGKLRQAVLKGKVSSEEFFEAFLKGTEDLSKRAQAMPVTVGQAFTRMQNNINQAIGDVNMTPLVDEITKLSDQISDPEFQQGFASFVSGIIKLSAVSIGAVAEIGNVAKFVGEAAAARLHGVASDDIVRLEDLLEKLKEFRSLGVLHPDFLDRGRFFGPNGVIEWYSDADLDRAITEIQQKIKRFYDGNNAGPIITAPGTNDISGDRPPPPPSEEFLKLSDKLKEQIALYGKVGKAAEVAYQIQSGALDELSKSEQQQLLALARRYDAIVKVEDAKKKSSEEQKKAEEEIRKMIAAAEEQIATFGKGEAAVVAYRLAHSELSKAFPESAAASEEMGKKIDDLIAKMEGMDTSAISAARSLTDLAENAQKKAADSSENLKQKLIDVTLQLEIMKEAADGAAEAISEFASKNSESLDQGLESFEKDFEKRFLKTADMMTVFQEQAARNTQDIIADALVNGFEDGADGILKSFGDMIVKLTAQAVAADIAKRLFGDPSVSGDGWVGIAMKAAGAFFGGGRAIGGPVLAGTTYRINEREPEFFRPRVGGNVIPLSKMNMGGGMVVNQNFSVRSETGERVSRSTEQQIAAAASRGMAVASRRNN